VQFERRPVSYRPFAVLAVQSAGTQTKGGGTPRLKERKAELIDQLEAELKGSSSMIIADYRGLSVKQLAELRNEIRPHDASFYVAKNTLARIAVQRAGVEGLLEFLTGPTAIAFCKADAAPVAKALAKASKDTQILQIKGGLIDGAVLDADGIKTLATLPSRDQLHAQLVVALNGPIQGLASTLAAIPRGLVVALDQIEKQKAAA
jgi:large subunit ribosomal protein L10